MINGLKKRCPQHTKWAGHCVDYLCIISLPCERLWLLWSSHFSPFLVGLSSTWHGLYSVLHFWSYNPTSSEESSSSSSLFCRPYETKFLLLPPASSSELSSLSQSSGSVLIRVKLVIPWEKQKLVTLTKTLTVCRSAAIAHSQVPANVAQLQGHVSCTWLYKTPTTRKRQENRWFFYQKRWFEMHMPPHFDSRN